MNDILNNMTAVKKDGRGGVRPGAGRPRKGAKTVCFRASQDVVDYIEKQEDHSGVLRELTELGLGVKLRQEQSERGVVMPLAELESEVQYSDSSIVCGKPDDIGDIQFEMVKMRDLLAPHPDQCVAIQARGNSMLDAGIKPGDVVVIDTTQQMPKNERQVVACLLNGEFTLKHVRIDEEGVWLVPSSPDPQYKKIHVDETDNFYVRGIVRSVIRNM